MKKILILVISTVIILTFVGCSNKESSKQVTTSNPIVSTAQGTPSVSNDNDPARPQVHLDSVKFLGEFESIKVTNKNLSDTETQAALDVVPQSRFVIFKYDFTTLDLAGSLATYGGTVGAWQGNDKNATDIGLGGKHMLLDSSGATFENGVFTVTGNPSQSFTYKTNEKHTQYWVMVVPNSVKTDDINITFSKKSTISDIGFDFKAEAIQ